MSKEAMQKTVEQVIDSIMAKVVGHETLVNLGRADQLMENRADIRAALREALAQPEQEHDLNKVAQAMYEAFDKVWYEGCSKYDVVSPCVSWMVNSKEMKAAWIAAAKEAAKQFGVLPEEDKIAYHAGVAHGYEKAKGELGK